jgi:hypothetical protein
VQRLQGLVALPDEEGAFRVAAMRDALSVLEELRRREPVIRRGPGNPLHSNGSNEVVTDLRREPAYSERQSAAVTWRP